eukprot:4778875-Prymnesium_polylepis.1
MCHVGWPRHPVERFRKFRKSPPLLVFSHLRAYFTCNLTQHRATRERHHRDTVAESSKAAPNGAGRSTHGYSAFGFHRYVHGVGE